jgi:hypothetical protein
MEAATPLHPPRIRILGDHLVVDGFVVRDPGAVRLVRDRAEAGEEPLKVLADALEVGARVLDREQAAVNTEFVRTEFQSAYKELERAFSERARVTAEGLDRKVDELFGEEEGHLTRELKRHFSDESSQAVQHRVREMVAEILTRSREDLLRQFSSADGSNPLADFKAGTVEVLERAERRREEHQRALLAQVGGLQKELQALRDQREKEEAVEAERERGTAKGRVFEEVVAEALDSIAAAQGDVAEAVGDVKGATRKTGDVVVEIDACAGPARGRIVFEAKDSRLPRPEAMRQLDRGLRERDADFAVLVVPTEEELPARTRPLREYNGDKLLVAWDPERDDRLALELAYSLARARVLMASGEAEGVDAATVHDTVERALGALEDVRKVKSQLTGATTQIDNARELVEGLAERARGYLRDIDSLVAAREPSGSGQQQLI